MKVQLWAVGKANDRLFDAAVKEYSTRIGHYFPVAWRLFPASKRKQEADIMAEETDILLQAIRPDDVLVVLDEHGSALDSVQLSSFIEKQSFRSTKNLVFAIGGAYGFAPALLEKAHFVWSLSPLTFPHQLVRVILAEQIYRACTILRNEGYHHG